MISTLGRHAGFAGGCVILLAATASASITVNHDEAALGSAPLDGLSAASTWTLNGKTLMITVRNTSTSAPTFANEMADALAVSLAFDLGDRSIMSGDSALIASGAYGLGTWSDRVAGDSVAEQWIWTNDFGGDQLELFPQVISTSNGQGGGSVTSFDGLFESPLLDANVQGPWGGIASKSLLGTVPGNQFAVSDGITFTLQLSSVIDEATLAMIAEGSVIEFGSDFRYAGVPAPGALGLLALAGLAGRRRRDG